MDVKFYAANLIKTLTFSIDPVIASIPLFAGFLQLKEIRSDLKPD